MRYGTGFQTDTLIHHDRTSSGIDNLFLFSTLIDPMCGSGTFLLEAVQMALDRAPGLDRGFAFELLKKFEALTWADIRAAAEARVKPAERMDIRGWDIDDRAVRATRHQIRRCLQDSPQGKVMALAAGKMCPLTSSSTMRLRQ